MFTELAITLIPSATHAYSLNVSHFRINSTHSFGIHLSFPDKTLFSSRFFSTTDPSGNTTCTHCGHSVNAYSRDKNTGLKEILIYYDDHIYENTFKNYLKICTCIIWSQELQKLFLIIQCSDYNNGYC